MFPGSPLSTGPVESTTVTVKLAVAVFEFAVAEQTTVVVPRRKGEPDAGAQMTGMLTSSPMR
jgi:hypothetical protein